METRATAGDDFVSECLQWQWPSFFQALTTHTDVTAFRLTLPYPFPSRRLPSTQKVFDRWGRRINPKRNITLEVISEACGWVRKNNGQRLLKVHSLKAGIHPKHSWAKTDNGKRTECLGARLLEERDATVLGPLDLHMCGRECRNKVPPLDDFLPR